MKSLIPCFFFYLFISLCNKAIAQNDNNLSDKSNHFSMGIQINGFGKDFGWGLNFTSPFFAKNRIAVRLSAQYQYYEHIDTSKNEFVWSPYAAFKLGMVSTSNILLDFLRLYSHTGVVIAIPNAIFSDVPVAFGAYSKLGIEFLFSSNGKAMGSYFVEGGWIGIFSKANLLESQPIYGNGFLASTGVRFYF